MRKELISNKTLSIFPRTQHTHTHTHGETETERVRCKVLTFSDHQFYTLVSNQEPAPLLQHEFAETPLINNKCTLQLAFPLWYIMQLMISQCNYLNKLKAGIGPNRRNKRNNELLSENDMTLHS